MIRQQANLRIALALELLVQGVVAGIPARKRTPEVQAALNNAFDALGFDAIVTQKESARAARKTSAER